MTKNQKLFAGIDALVEAEGINRELVIEGLEEALANSVKKYYNYVDVEVNIDYEKKRMSIHGSKLVVDKNELGEAFNDAEHIDIDEALIIKKSAKIGHNLKQRLKLVPELMDRSTVQTAKQVFKQKLREAKYRKIIEDYGDKVGELVFGILEDQRDKVMYFSLPGNIDAVLPASGQVPGETIEPDVPVMLVIDEILEQKMKGPKVIVSRSNPRIVSRIMEEYIPEVKDGTIKVHSIAREAGDRSKISIELKDLDADVDIIAACVGAKGSRINNVRKDLGGENIDLVEYFDDPVLFISNALAPALVTAVQILDETAKTSRVVVPDDQLSLAIGANGQNVRLASFLTGWKIDIESETSALEKGIDFEDDII